MNDKLCKKKTAIRDGNTPDLKVKANQLQTDNCIMSDEKPRVHCNSNIE